MTAVVPWVDLFTLAGDVMAAVTFFVVFVATVGVAVAVVVQAIRKTVARVHRVPVLRCAETGACLLDWPRVRDLPDSERSAFDGWLAGRDRPWQEGVIPSEQDGYYPHHYTEWKADR